MKYNSKRIAFVFVGIFVLMFSIQFVAAQEDSFIGDTRELLEKWGILPDDIVGNDILWIFVGVFGSLVLVLITADLLMMISPWSDYINWVIAIGIFIVLTLVGVIRNLVAYVFSFAGVLFGAGSALALVMTAILFIFAVIFIFFGGNWIRAWIIRTKRNKWVLTAKKKGAKRGARITEGAETLETVAEGA